MTSSTVTTKDTRNLNWRNDNVGSKLLEKMGWKDGQALGRRLRKSASTASSSSRGGGGGGEEGNAADNGDTASEVNSGVEEATVHHSSEGLRVRRRADGLGLGASTTVAASSNHTADFASLLKQLNSDHPNKSALSSSSDNEKSEKKKKKSKKRSKKDKKDKDESNPSSSSVVVLPTNKSTHARVRQAKFQARSADDMKAIFGSAVDFPSAGASSSFLSASSSGAVSSSGGGDKKKRKKKDKKEKGKSEKEKSSEDGPTRKKSKKERSA